MSPPHTHKGGSAVLEEGRGGNLQQAETEAAEEAAEQQHAEVVAEENEAHDSNGKPKRKRGERTGDKKKRACRTCTRCVSNNGTNGKICKGRHPCNGTAKCEFFDAGGVKRKGKQNIDEEEDASTKKDGYGGV